MPIAETHRLARDRGETQRPAPPFLALPSSYKTTTFYHRQEYWPTHLRVLHQRGGHIPWGTLFAAGANVLCLLRLSNAFHQASQAEA